MHYTRIYANEKGETLFEEIQVSLNENGVIGSLSEKFPVKYLQFRETSANYEWDFHNAPNKQFIILLEGVIEIEVSTGPKRVFVAGDILLLEDTFGKGHRTRNLLLQNRKSIFVII